MSQQNEHKISYRDVGSLSIAIDIYVIRRLEGTLTCPSVHSTAACCSLTKQLCTWQRWPAQYQLHSSRKECRGPRLCSSL